MKPCPHWLPRRMRNRSTKCWRMERLLVPSITASAERLLVWIRDELRTISMDELNHSALAWRTLDWVCRVDAIACDATEQSVLVESKLVEAFHRQFGQNVEYSPQVLERMILTWRNIYTSRGVPPINIGSGHIGVVVEEATGHHASKPLFESLLVDNISRV